MKRMITSSIEHEILCRNVQDDDTIEITHSNSGLPPKSVVHVLAVKRATSKLFGGYYGLVVEIFQLPRNNKSRWNPGDVIKLEFDPNEKVGYKIE